MDKRSYSMSEIRGIGREEVPQVQGHGRCPKVQGCDSTGAASRSYPVSDRGQGWRAYVQDWDSAEAAKRRYLTPEAWGGG